MTCVVSFETQEVVSLFKWSLFCHRVLMLIPYMLAAVINFNDFAVGKGNYISPLTSERNPYRPQICNMVATNLIQNLIPKSTVTREISNQAVKVTEVIPSHYKYHNSLTNFVFKQISKRHEGEYEGQNFHAMNVLNE